MSNPCGAGAEVTEVATVADVLLSSLLSAIVLLGATTAVLARLPVVAGAVALMVIVAFAPWLTAPPSQVMVTGLPADAQTNRLVPLADTKPTPAGRVSTTRTFVALAVPVLLTVRT